MASMRETDSTKKTELPSGAWGWLRDRLFPRGTNLIQITSYLILITLIILFVLQTPEGLSAFQFSSTLVMLSILLVVQVLMNDIVDQFKDKTRGTWFVLILSTLLTFFVIGVGRMFMGVYLLFMLVAQANATFRPRFAISYSALLLAAYLGILDWAEASTTELVSTLIGVSIAMIFVITLSQVLLRYSEQTERANALLAQLQQANTELMEMRQKEKDLIIAEERVRMARDLHDGLGHHLTALSIQLQAAEKMIHTRPIMAAEAIGNARGEIQAALKEVRQSVAALRESPVELNELPQTIARLVEECGRTTGLRAHFELNGTPVALSPATAMTLFRTAQEGLTNVQKHANSATQITARLAYDTGQVALRIEDDGSGDPDCPPPGSERAGRFGLAGLRERAGLLGGSLDCGALPKGGFFLQINLPETVEAA